MFKKTKAGYLTFLNIYYEDLKGHMHSVNELKKVREAMDSFNFLDARVISYHDKKTRKYDENSDTWTMEKVIACKTSKDGLTGYFDSENSPVQDDLGKKVYLLRYEKRLSKERNNPYLKVYEWTFVDPLEKLRQREASLLASLPQRRVLANSEKLPESQTIEDMKKFKHALRSIGLCKIFEKETSVKFDLLVISTSNPDFLSRLDASSFEYLGYVEGKENVLFYVIYKRSTSILYKYVVSKGDDVDLHAEKFADKQMVNEVESIAIDKSVKNIFGNLKGFVARRHDR